MFRLIGPLGAGRGGIVVLFFGAVFRLIELRIRFPWLNGTCLLLCPLAPGTTTPPSHQQPDHQYRHRNHWKPGHQGAEADQQCIGHRDQRIPARLQPAQEAISLDLSDRLGAQLHLQGGHRHLITKGVAFGLELLQVGLTLAERSLHLQELLSGLGFGHDLDEPVH